MKSKIMKVPVKMYNFLKNNAQAKNTTMKREADCLLDEYLDLKKLENHLEKRRGRLFIIK